MEALILAAGRGNRMRPFSDFLPKPLLPIEGEAVILQSVKTLKACGFKRLFITVGYLKEKIIDFLENHKPAGMVFKYVYQEEPSGSAVAIRLALDKIKEDFLTLAGDTVFLNEDIRRLIEVFELGDYDAVVGLKQVKKEDLKEKSSTHIDSQGFLRKVIEKPEAGQELSNVSVAPVYLFRCQVIKVYLEKVQPSKEGIYELATALQSLIDDGGKVKGVFIRSSKDITFPADVLKHNFDYLKPYLNL